MKTKQPILTALAALLLGMCPVFGIEGIKLQIHCPDVVLSWPSVEWSGEAYIVQYRETLDTNSQWITLTNLMQPDAGSNMTIFVHSNRVACPTGQIFGMMFSGTGGGGSWTHAANEKKDFKPWFPMVIPKDGSRVPVPLGIYPVGIDLSGYIIIWADGSTDEWSKELVETWRAFQWEEGDPQTEDGGGGGGGAPGCGFYRVVRNGVWLFGLTNGTLLAGIVPVPVEAGYTNGTLGSVTLTANGRPIEGTVMLSAPLPGMLSFAVDTRRLVNGDYYFQANGTWSFDSTNEFENPSVQFYSPVVLVTISNQIMYPEWIQDFRDDLALFKITSAQTNVDWRVDVYGESGNNVGSFTNHSADGVIDFSWNLQDTNGTPQTDFAFTTVTTLTATGSPPVIATNPPLIKVVDNYPDQGMWLVARASYIPVTVGNYGLYTNGVNYFAQLGESAGGVAPGQPYRNPGQAMILSKATATTNWSAMLRTFRTNHAVRNFYFDGHGGPDWIGVAYDTNGNPVFKVVADTVARALTNDVPSTNSTRFRWVWIDSCNSALGAWPQAFGLGTRENVPLSNYTSRPGAFCGFDREVYGWTLGFHGMGGSVDTKSIDFRGFFLYFWWFEDDPLISAFDQAEFWSNFSDAQYLKVYGYWGLHWSEFNTKAEWP